MSALNIDFTGVEAWVIYTVLFLTALGYILNKLRKFVRWCWRSGRAMRVRTRQFNREWDALVALVQYQLRHNGGDSLLDMVGRIDSNHEEAKKYWAELKANDDEIEQRLDYGNRILTVAFHAAPKEQQDAVTEWAKNNPPPGAK